MHPPDVSIPRFRFPPISDLVKRPARASDAVHIDESESSAAHLTVAHGDRRSGLVKTAKCGRDRLKAKQACKVQVGRARASLRSPYTPHVVSLPLVSRVSCMYNFSRGRFRMRAPCKHRVTCAGIGTHAA